ncbi:hypothetical protein KDA_44960 [Dictyobacter alpinus]|uniref:AraC effector-binding domain-containing protein n=1 Tax=Dictyobacter alpinus TaxID=2014873 RepID=A0A402BCK3_9CHLR|nr:GyrI-like domain-containing protein [Dictyobacter alpinus]GCE29012.1 hypothetical protein KDA_44960 [Dictyobacter alpinus]
MKITEPKIEQRAAQPYMGIRTQVTMEEFGQGVIPQLLGEVMGWLSSQGTGPTGAPFIRYHVINMPSLLDIELGWPVASPLTGTDRIHAHTLPAGRYASLIFTGIENGIQGNGALLDWGHTRGLKWDQWETEHGDAFGARVETEITNPADEPDPSKWETEVAIRLADE